MCHYAPDSTVNQDVSKLSPEEVTPVISVLIQDGEPTIEEMVQSRRNTQGKGSLAHPPPHIHRSISVERTGHQMCPATDRGFPLNVTSGIF